MNTTVNSINQVIKVLAELEAKGCHSVFLEYGNGTIHVRIFKGEVKADNIVYEKRANVIQEQAEIIKMYEHINNMKYYVVNTPFQCYRREFITGEKSGELEKTKSSFLSGENATKESLIDNSGYYITDTDNGLQYFVDMKHLGEKL